MKEVLIILDGLMEDKLEKYSFKKLVLGDLDLNFKEEMMNFSVRGKDIDSLNCIMNILGYNANAVDIGDRAYYEGLNRGINIKEYQSILRCNIVKIEDGILQDFTGGNLSENIADIIKGFKVCNGRIFPCYKYRNLLLLDEKIEETLYPPHFHVREKINDISPKDGIIRDIMNESYIYFKEKGLEGLMLWPWGKSDRVKLEKLNRKAGLISGIDLVLGIGKAVGMKVIQPEGSTGDCDTRLEEKLFSFKKLIEEVDYVVVHINGFDELAHRKDFNGKMKFIEDVKDKFLVPLIEIMKNYKQYNIYITCDHRTDSFTGVHEEKNVPFITIIN